MHFFILLSFQYFLFLWSAATLVEELQKVAVAVVTLAHNKTDGRILAHEVHEPAYETILRREELAHEASHFDGAFGTLVALGSGALEYRLPGALFVLFGHRNVGGVDICIGNGHVHPLSQ